MKAYKLILVFAVIIFSIVAIFWSLGLINKDQVLDISGKSIMVVLILGLSSLVVFKLLNVPKSDKKESSSRSQGPKF